MNIVYFTLGSGVTVSHIREQLLRIPEVISEIKFAQLQNPDWDLMVAFMVPEVFEALSESRKEFAVALIQKALFTRWMKQKHSVDVILRRAFYKKKEQLVGKISQCFTEAFEKNVNSEQKIYIYVIGPGMDELNLYVKELLQDASQKVEIIECLGLDPALYWFWPKVQNAMIEMTMN